MNREERRKQMIDLLAWREREHLSYRALEEVTGNSRDALAAWSARLRREAMSEQEVRGTCFVERALAPSVMCIAKPCDLLRPGLSTTRRLSDSHRRRNRSPFRDPRRVRSRERRSCAIVPLRRCPRLVSLHSHPRTHTGMLDDKVTGAEGGPKPCFPLARTGGSDSRAWRARRHGSGDGDGSGPGTLMGAK